MFICVCIHIFATLCVCVEGCSCVCQRGETRSCIGSGANLQHSCCDMYVFRHGGVKGVSEHLEDFPSWLWEHSSFCNRTSQSFFGLFCYRTLNVLRVVLGCTLRESERLCKTAACYRSARKKMVTNTDSSSGISNVKSLFVHTVIISF